VITLEQHQRAVKDANTYLELGMDFELVVGGVATRNRIGEEQAREIVKQVQASRVIPQMVSAPVEQPHEEQAQVQSVAEPDETDREVTDDELVDRTVELLEQRKTDTEIEAVLRDEYEGIDSNLPAIIKDGHDKLIATKERQEKELEAERSYADDLKQTATSAVDEALAARFEAKKQRVEKELIKQAKGLGNATPQEIHQLSVEFEEVQKRESEWREPKSINPLPEVQKFDLTFLPGSIRARVEDVAQRTSTPLDFAGIASVLCLAGVTGRRVFVYPMAKNKEWREPIALSGILVASSGKVKTPVWKSFTDPVVEHDAELKQQYQKEMKLFKIRAESWESQRKAAEKQKTLFDLPKPEEPPIQRSCTINDATPEALHSAMQDNPEGYLYYRDELSGFVEELDAPNRESQRTIFMTAMDGDGTYTMKRIGRGEVSARMCASVCGNFQPNRLEAFLNNARNIEDGLVPRFSLMVYPRTDFHGLVDKTVNQEAKLVYRHIVRQLAKMKVATIQMHFAEDAQAVFTEWLERMMRRIDQEESDWIRSHLSKYKGTLPKLAALFQLVDIIAAAGQTTGADVSFESEVAPGVDRRALVANHHLIDVAHLEQSMRFLAYLESHMYKVYNTVRSPLAKAETMLAARIKDGSLKPGFTFRDITRKRWRDLANPEIVREALESLEQAHWIRPAKPELIISKGRPRGESWEINPAVLS
jgi:hypothetical protein